MQNRISFQLLHAMNRQKVMFENVNIDWNLQHEDGSTDFSDEETLEDAPRTLNRTPDKKNNRPISVGFFFLIYRKFINNLKQNYQIVIITIILLSV